MSFLRKIWNRYESLRLWQMLLIGLAVVLSGPLAHIMVFGSPAESSSTSQPSASAVITGVNVLPGPTPSTSTTIPQARDEDLMQADIEYYQECEYIITVENHSGHERSFRITTEKGSREVSIPGWRTSSETQYEPVAHVEITTLSGKILKRKMLSMPIQCHNGVNLTRVPH